MDRKEKEFLKKLRATFKIEAEEHLAAMSSELISLENSEDPAQLAASIESVYRAAHSLKGAARAVGLRDVESVCQSLESVVSSIKKQELAPSQMFFDVALKTVDILNQLVNEQESAPVGDILREIESLLQERREPGVAKPEAPVEVGTAAPAIESPAMREPVAEKPSEPVQPAEPSVEKPQRQEEDAKHAAGAVQRRLPQSDTIRISTARLDALLYQVEEMVSIKIAAAERLAELRTLAALLDAWEKTWKRVRTDLRRFQEVCPLGKTPEKGPDAETLRLIDYLVKHETLLKDAVVRTNRLSKNAENESRSIGGMIDVLMDDMKTLLMMPFASLLEPFPKLVRDISHDQGKEVALIVEGQEVEIDRRILEEMKDPLIHLVRNSLDHGLEKPDVRIRHRKPPQGTLRIQVSQQSSNKIEILVSDDGAGIDVAKVKKAAVSRQVVSEKELEGLSNQEALGLIFRSDVSTSDIITDLSGRGLGLAIVQEKVDKLGGHVSVESTPLEGTSFRIVLPVTLATFRGILAECNQQLFVIPTSSVQRVVRIKKDSVRRVENRDTVVIRDRVLLFVWLAEVLNIADGKDHDDEDFISAVVLNAGQRSVAFGIDRIVSEQEVIVKGLGKQLARVRNVAGATVLSSGEVVPILNVSDLVKSALSHRAVSTGAATQRRAAQKKRSRILVAEDSITSRTLLRNILESAGYDVETVVDGWEAWQILRSRNFDLLVSDVQMPKMDGFELTEKIRADKKLAELPVVLVTSLESPEDRERGIDVGASAYIVKSSFDQSNLLEVVGRLL
jgi:two-component system chemotaxis sensor kinase CheA